MQEQALGANDGPLEERFVDNEIPYLFDAPFGL
jgi:hypothetical protein